MANREVTIDLRERRVRRDVTSGRTLHLVDLENLAGGSGATEAEVSAALESYERVVRLRWDDHRVVACGRLLAYPAKRHWSGSLVKACHGVDGADRLLSAEAAPAFVRGRYDRVVVASGDHCFTELVIELDASGVDVCVVSRREALARRLAAAAPVVWYLDDAPVLAGAA